MNNNLGPCAADFREWAEYIYFHGHTTVDRLAYELYQYHYAGVEHTEGSAQLLDVLTDRIRSHGDPYDYHNALSVVLADLVCRAAPSSTSMPDIDTFRSRYGPLGHIVLRQLLASTIGQLPGGRPNNPVTRNELVRFVSVFAPHRMTEFLNSELVPRQLPLIEFLKRSMRPVHESISTLVCVQHLFGSTRPLIAAIAQSRVSPGGVFVLGKPYSTNHATMWTLRNEHNYFVHEGSFRFSGSGEYHDEADQHVEDLLNRVVRWMRSRTVPEHSRALLLDDGGRAIRKLHEPMYEDIRPRMTCVEQTRRGVRELDDIELQVPVINVAESKAKLVHESPLIATSVKTELIAMLARLEDAGVPVARRALVIGFGAIGEAVADVLVGSGWQVGIYDASDERRHAALVRGYTVEQSLEVALPRYSELIGCTGSPSVRHEHYGLLRDGTVLVSASSSDVEFEAWNLRGHATVFSARHRDIDKHNLVYERFGNRLLFLGDLDHPSHFLYLVRIRGRRIFLVNGGFPVNMNGDVDPIPAEVIQLTRALLYAGAVQASYEDRPGLHALDEAVQQQVVNTYVSF